MSESANVMKMIAGLDIGNGYVKGLINVDGTESVVDFLSGVALETNSMGIKTTRSEDVAYDVEHIFDCMDASFDTPAVRSRTSRLFGKRGVHSGKAMEEFDVVSTVSKAQQDLSAILVLGSLAGKALQTYYDAHQALPGETLHCAVAMAIALPIAEYRSYKNLYIERFKGLNHLVSIHNFEL